MDEMITQTGWLDEEISFFDSPEEKKRKKKYLTGLTAEEQMERKNFLESLEELAAIEDGMSESEVQDNLPSIFDTPESYVKKYALLNGKYNGKELKAVEDVRFPISEITYSNTADRIVTTVTNVPPIVHKNIKLLGPYRYEDGSMIYFCEANGEEVWICNFWFEILEEKIHVEEIVNEQNIVIDKKEESSWLMKIWCMGEEFIVDVPMKHIFNEQELLKLTHDRGYIEQEKVTKKLFRKFILRAIESKTYRKVYEYGATGWTKLKTGQFVYLTDKGAIGHPEINAYAKTPFIFTYDSNRVGTKAVFDEFLQLRSLCGRKKGNSTFLMHYSCLATMTTLYQEIGHPINFILALIGATNSFKTSSAIVFTKLFDRTTKAIPDLRFNSTEVAIMEKMESYGDAILLVDDFLPYENKGLAKEQMKKSETIIRSYGDRVPRKRSKAYAMANGIKEFSRVKGCCVITGELFDTNSESSSTRVIELGFSQGDVNLERLTFFQENLLNVPTLLYDYICFIQEKLEWIFELIKNETTSIRNNQAVPLKVPRYRDTFALMVTQITIFYIYAVVRGFLCLEEAELLKNEDIENVLQIIICNERKANVKSPATTICQALTRAIAKKEVMMLNTDECRGVNDFDNIVIDFEEFYLIHPDALWIVYRDYCQNTYNDVMYKSGRELAAPLKKEGAILLKEEGSVIRSTHKFSPISSKRFFFIKKEIISKNCENFEFF